VAGRKVIVVFGTRPEAIKLAPVVRALRARPEAFETVVAVTGQHREMLDQVLGIFNIESNHDLDIMRPGQSLFDVTGRALAGLEEVYTAERPDVLLVQGDTTTAFVGALAAYYLRIQVGHVEAGLRTGDKFRPFPEEINRRLVGVLGDYHFAPTQTAKANLLDEGADSATVFVTGNTVIDALLDVTARPYTFRMPELADLDDRRRLVLVTIHRRESFGPPMEEMCQAVAEVAASADDLDVVLPVHPNPRVQETVRSILTDVPRVHLTEPLDYEAFAHLMKRCTLVLTDSGGVQEEAPSLGKPVLVLREKTERPEAIEAGTARLVGVDRARIVAEARRLLEDADAYAVMARAANPYGDGRAAERIADVLEGKPVDSWS
jgi:UDP-N-acetylglucosamine 2-epimerase (non-hydrolysing)